MAPNNMKNPACYYIAVMFLLLSSPATSQSVNDIFSNSGIWSDYGKPLSASTYPEFKGRLVNVSWSDIETSPNVWNWTIFDEDISSHVADSMPVIFMVYTRMDAPQWLFSNGVPKVNETNESGLVVGYSPYYLDPDYNFYFKRMITKVREHVETFESSVRTNIIGVQACFGSTGDQISYKGNVAKQYEITGAQFDSLFKVYSLCYYDEYKNLRPKIAILNNPNSQDPQQEYWLNDNCPGGWTKCGTMAKGFQLNTELDKLGWLYDIMNKPGKGGYTRSRCEITGDQLNAGWWTKNQYKNMFAIMCYCIYWGLDWPNETAMIIGDTKFDSAFHFFNKYAGQKVAAVASNAVCALKDVLDASDQVRFPASEFGTVDRDNKSRYTNIVNKFSSYGAKLEDLSVVNGSDHDCLEAKGINDVGWRLLPGNYERYLRQIDANITSAGYWNVDSDNRDVMYGRFARGFDLSKNKNALYFDVDDSFLRNMPLNGRYPVTIEVTYYDSGSGSWQLFYDAQSGSNRASVNVKCGNTKTWKKKTIVLKDAYFGNRGTRTSDFYIKSTGSANVIFSVVELSRPIQSDKGFFSSALPVFDTVCIKSSNNPESFVLNGGYLDGTNVQVGPLAGFTFSKSMNGPFSNSITYIGYGQHINATVYVKVNTATPGSFKGGIPVKGGGAAPVTVRGAATVINTSPVINPTVTPMSCYNANDASIDLSLIGGEGPFAYSWTSSTQKFWSASTQDIRNLKDADYSVVVTSAYGCSITQTFSIKAPDKLTAPAGINGPSSVIKQQSGVVFSVKKPNNSLQYVWTVPNGATITAGQNTSSVTVTWSKSSGNIKAQSRNDCGTSAAVTKYITATDAFDAVMGSNIKMIPETGTLMNYPVMIMPDPARDIALLRFYAASSFSYTVQVTDIAGKILLIKKGTATPGTNVENLHVQQFAIGLYFVTLINNKGEKQTVKLVKE